MKFTLSWLKSFLDTDLPLDEIVHKLTMIGLEVEEVIDRSIEFENFEVAEIIEAAPHPEADKLKICKVSTAAGILDIVCGAPNARAGIKVVLAKIGAVIPNGSFRIKQSRIRGIESCGMLCSAGELHIKEDSSGIMELPPEAKIGDPIAPYLGFDDPVIHINVTPNRADSLGVYGIARDLAAAGVGRLKKLEIPSVKAEFDSSVSINVLNPDACPLFAIREIKNIANMESPEWLKGYLKNIGIGSISAIVDITNYMSYSFGQPMHAYDADKIAGTLTVESLKSKEKFLALNDKEYELEQDDLVIRDAKGVQCLAGVMGGNNSSCGDETTRVILEGACFDSKHISRVGRRLMIETDSRYRFERHVDREFTLKALDYATNLVLTICGGGASARKMAGSDKTVVKTIDFPIGFFASRAGFILKNIEITDILERLGFKCLDKKESITITVPSWRYDVSIKEDIVEEIIRIHGYEKIPVSPLPASTVQKIINRGQKREMDIKRLLASQGYTELVTWSFMDSKKAELFALPLDELTLQNPISSELDYMRPSILPNMLETTRGSLNRSYRDLCFFELGPVFPNASDIIPVKSVAGIRTGNNLPKNCHAPVRQVNIFDIKADLEAIFATCSLDFDKFQIKNEAPPYYHPTRSATLMLGKHMVAFFGQLHPVTLKAFDIEVGVIAFEVNLSLLPMGKEKFGKKTEFKISDYQPVSRDYAFVVDSAQNIGEILAFIKNVDPNLIRSVNLFDIYTGEKIEAGKKSVAISTLMQDSNKTLTEEDINHVSKLIIEGVRVKFNACLREE